jgi:hypothetical protein
VGFDHPYWAKALECAERAEQTADPEVRQLFCRLRDSWIRAANHQEILKDAEIAPPSLRDLDAQLSHD